MTNVRASDWDREYMRRIGRYKEESHAQALAAHMALPPSERLLRIVTLMLQGSYFDAPVAEEDDPSPFYERARRLGLIKAR
jgi:hypothetical protein